MSGDVERRSCLSCTATIQIDSLRLEVEQEHVSATEHRKELSKASKDTKALVESLVDILQGENGLVDKVDLINRGMYGDKKNKVGGVIELLDYKAELRLVHWVRKKGMWVVSIAIAGFLTAKAKIWIGK